MTRIIIVGAGIIGSSTAFYLTQHQSYNPETTEIIIIEAVEPACAASGKAGGLLSKTAFPSEIAHLSFKLHRELAETFDGETNWGYRPVTAAFIEGSILSTHSSSRRSSRSSSDIVAAPNGLDWIRGEILTSAEELGGPTMYAQAHPYQLTNFFLSKAIDKGARLVNGKVVSLHAKNGKAQGVVYTKDGEPVQLHGDHVVVAAGPWVNKLVPECPIVGVKAHSITIEPTRQVSAHALFTELQLSKYDYVSPELYARRDEIYVCGEGSQEPVPETADLVTVQTEKCDTLFTNASHMSSEIEGGRVLCKQACFLPVVESRRCNGPFIGNTSVDNLIIAAGHTCWGINNAPATGKLVSEIVFSGTASSADISGLEPRKFFKITTLEELQ